LAETSSKIVEFTIEKQKFPNFKEKMKKNCWKKTLILSPPNNNAM
jgi:hypothetical protein